MHPIGDSTIICLSKKRLFTLSILNTAITCSALTAPINGEAPNCTDSTNVGSVCTFACSSGYRIVNSTSSTLTCGQDGNYDNQAPACES